VITGTHLAYIGLACGVGLVGCLVYGLCSAAKEGDEFVEQLLCEHHEAAQQQLDDFFVAVDEIRAECLEPEPGSVEWLEDLFMRKPEKVGRR
jgi:hypothetical protein